MRLILFGTCGVEGTLDIRFIINTNPSNVNLYSWSSNGCCDIDCAISGKWYSLGMYLLSCRNIAVFVLVPCNGFVKKNGGSQICQ